MRLTVKMTLVQTLKSVYLPFSLMEVTKCNLGHEKFIHRRVIYSQWRISKIHLLIISDNDSNDLKACPELDLHSFSAMIPFEFLFHPTWLGLIRDHDIYGYYDDPKGRYSLDLKDKQLHMNVSKELYEKLGLEGKKSPDGRFAIVLDLQDAKICTMSHKFRNRLLELSSQVLKGQMEVLFACSTSVFPLIRDLMETQKISFKQQKFESNLEEINDAIVPEFDIKNPITEELEEWNLWLGATITKPNILLSGSKVDPFISTCQLPNGASTTKVYHFQARSPTLILPALICEFIEGQCRAMGWKNICLVCKNHSGGGFAMYLNPQLDFVCCCST